VNWLKAMLLMVVLGAILYGVNLVLNKSAPVETPGNNGAWTGADGPIAPPTISPGTAGTNAPTGSGPSPYGQTPAGRSAYASGGYSTANPPTGYASNGGSPSSIPADNSAGAASPSAGGGGYPSGGYQPATPPIVNADSAHSGIPATPVGFATSSPNSAPPPGTASNSGGGAAFATAMGDATAILREGQLAEGLKRLTVLRDAPRLDSEEFKQLYDLMGRLAGTVVYSRQHLLLPAYDIRPGDRLEKIADDYQVPARLLAKINGISDPDHLPAGQQLKVIHGPFMAFVNLSRRDVTLIVQQCYAGRFKLIGMRKEVYGLSGNYKVDRKTLDAAHSIGFGDGFAFRGLTSDKPDDSPRGLWLSSADAEDLFDILSVGSIVVVY
jgi:hypothetical protein